MGINFVVRLDQIPVLPFFSPTKQLHVHLQCEPPKWYLTQWES